MVVVVVGVRGRPIASEVPTEAEAPAPPRAMRGKIAAPIIHEIVVRGGLGGRGR